MEPIRYRNRESYYISNLMFDDYYLCASSEHGDRSRHRRMVYAKKMDQKELQNNPKCMWTISLVKNRQSSYIWNVFYEQPLYSGGLVYKSLKTNARKAFLWHRKPDSTQFLWDLICHNIYQFDMPFVL
jgi:hypothetical protein